MYRLSSPIARLCAATAAGFTLRAGEARAQTRAPDLASSATASASGATTLLCEQERRVSEALTRTLVETERAKVAALKDQVECRQDLETASERIAQCQSSVKTCQTERERICSATGSFIDKISRGKSQSQGELECISGEQRGRLEAAAGSARWLGQLSSYQSGESDSLPYLRPGNSPAERMIARLMSGSGAALLNRRLLISALKLIAPQWWETLRRTRGAGIDAWFLAATSLDSDLVTEAQRVPLNASTMGGAPLSLSLSLVRAFQVAATCTDATSVNNDCRRAKQLQDLLESSSSLVLQRRLQEIWSSECILLKSSSILPWVEDFPSPHVVSQSNPWDEIAQAAHRKLFACYLSDTAERAPYSAWLTSVSPPAKNLTQSKLSRLDAIRAQSTHAATTQKCANAVRALQVMQTPSACELPSAAFESALGEWSEAAAKMSQTESFADRMCADYTRLLWEGHSATLRTSFPRAPTAEELVTNRVDETPSPMARLRAHCDDRRGNAATFTQNATKLAEIARGLGEAAEERPFRVDRAQALPIEAVRFSVSQGFTSWIEHLARGTSACSMVGLSDERCSRCNASSASSAFDCTLVARLSDGWSKRSQRALTTLALAVLAALSLRWAQRLRSARTTFGVWQKEGRTFFGSLGLLAKQPALRALLPSRYDSLELALPEERAWDSWGKRAWVIRAPHGTTVSERDVNRAAFLAKRSGASVALLEHDDDAAPDLSAIRAMLEWAAKGGSHAVQILPMTASRTRWSKSAHDILELVEESSLRGNPFELRGRVTTSAQFFSRERLVSGLLAAVQAGHWTVVTGLRRFGKSSLALEIARRLPGPSAYVDLSGFSHEAGHAENPVHVADAILRFICISLGESARARWPALELPLTPQEGAPLSAATLTVWLRELSRKCRDVSGRPPPFLIVVDEVEHLLGLGPAKLGSALEVLATVVGRLKSAVGDAAISEGTSPMGMLLGSELHPLLWAPLKTLANQSLMGSFQRVCVPRLDDDAAASMMRSLGARRGIRFTDPALERLIAEAQGIPLLLRRLGAAVLELYDSERARQGSLGAVEIGIEGASEAIVRETQEGSPSRVWIETEIAATTTVSGILLRRLACQSRVSTQELQTIAKAIIAQDFIATGMNQTLNPEEQRRRVEEAAHVTVRLLGETGLLVIVGDLTNPDAYTLPDGIIRQVLGRGETSHAV
jgi:hypothetical protein